MLLLVAYITHNCGQLCHKGSAVVKHDSPWFVWVGFVGFKHWPNHHQIMQKKTTIPYWNLASTPFPIFNSETSTNPAPQKATRHRGMSGPVLLHVSNPTISLTLWIDHQGPTATWQMCWVLLIRGKIGVFLLWVFAGSLCCLEFCEMMFCL